MTYKKRHALRATAPRSATPSCPTCVEVSLAGRRVLAGAWMNLSRISVTRSDTASHVLIAS